MAFQEVTSTGWLGRIGKSLKGILFGLVLTVASLAVLIFNERNAVRDIQANREIAAEVTSIGIETIDPSREGALVHLRGPAATSDLVRNVQFGIEENAIRLGWKAEIYQWVEEKETQTRKKLGGGEETVTTYSYRQKWVGGPVDSSNFKEAGHENGTKASFRSGMDQASLVTVGSFQLPAGLVSQIRTSEPYPLPSLPPALQEKGSLEAGVFHTGAPDTPQVGDERVTFSITKPMDVSVMAVQAGNSFQPYRTKSGKEKFLLYEGLLSAEDIVAEEKAKAKLLRWILRGVGFILMFVGLVLALKPLSVLADVIPFIGSLVGGATAVISFFLALGISTLTIAVSWLTFRPMLGIPLLVVALASFAALLLAMGKNRRRLRSSTPPPPPQPA